MHSATRVRIQTYTLNVMLAVHVDKLNSEHKYMEPEVTSIDYLLVLHFHETG